MKSLDLLSLPPQFINLADETTRLGRNPVAAVTAVAAILGGAPPALDELAHGLRHGELAKDVVELLGPDDRQQPAVHARGLQGQEAAQLAQALTSAWPDSVGNRSETSLWASEADISGKP